MRGDGMGTTYWICLIESFQMSTNVRGLLCEGVMIWVPLNNRSLRAGKELYVTVLGTS